MCHAIFLPPTFSYSRVLRRDAPPVDRGSFAPCRVSVGLCSRAWTSLVAGLCKSESAICAPLLVSKCSASCFTLPHRSEARRPSKGNSPRDLSSYLPAFFCISSSGFRTSTQGSCRPHGAGAQLARRPPKGAARVPAQRPVFETAASTPLWCHRYSLPADPSPQAQSHHRIPQVAPACSRWSVISSCPCELDQAHSSSSSARAEAPHRRGNLSPL